MQRAFDTFSVCAGTDEMGLTANKLLAPTKNHAIGGFHREGRVAYQMLV
jgi:hypothetical protein